MSIDGVASYGEIYSLTDDEIELYDSVGIEWRGRNVLDIRDDFCIKNIMRFAQVYLLTSLTNPSRLPELKAEIIEIFETTFEIENDEEDEPSAILYRFDPISGTYHEIIGAERKYFKSAGKCFKKAGKVVEKGARKVKHAVGKGARETGRWVREHPVQTGVIVVAAVTLGVSGAALAGAGSIAGDSGSNHDRDSNRDNNKPSSPHRSSSNSTSSTNHAPPTSEVQCTNQNWPPQDLPTATSNLLAQEFTSSWNDPYRISKEYNDRNYSSFPQAVPNSLIHEPKTYSAPASITDIPKSSSYATSSKSSPTSTQHFPNSSSPIDRHSMEFSMSQLNGINPSAFHASLFPGYQEPQTHHLSSTPPQGTSPANLAKEEHWADFVKGASNGFSRGCVDSVKETPSTLWTIVKFASGYALDPIIHPLKHLPGQEIVSQTHAVYETIAYLRTCEDGEVSKATGELIRAVAPEAHKLFTDWDNLSIEERGDLSAYCLGKYGTDFLLPIVAAKGAKIAGGVLKEASVFGRAIGAGATEVEAVGSFRMQVKPNTILPPPGRLAAELNVTNIHELIRVGQNTPLLARELGFTGRDIARLTLSGDLEKTVVGAFENIVRDSAMLESLERFRKASVFLTPYQGQYLSETLAKDLIHQTGIKTFPRPIGISENFRVRIADKGAGIVYIHPEHTHTSIRIMPGKPHSPFPYQQNPYVICKKNGKTFDNFGNVVDSASPEAHIPVDEFIFKD